MGNQHLSYQEAFENSDWRVLGLSREYSPTTQTNRQFNNRISMVVQCKKHTGKIKYYSQAKDRGNWVGSTLECPICKAERFLNRLELHLEKCNLSLQNEKESLLLEIAERKNEWIIFHFKCSKCKEGSLEWKLKYSRSLMGDLPSFLCPECDYMRKKERLEKILENNKTSGWKVLGFSNFYYPWDMIKRNEIIFQCKKHPGVIKLRSYRGDEENSLAIPICPRCKIEEFKKELEKYSRKHNITIISGTDQLEVEQFNSFLLESKNEYALTFKTICNKCGNHRKVLMVNYKKWTNYNSFPAPDKCKYCRENESIEYLKRVGKGNLEIVGVREIPKTETTPFRLQVDVKYLSCGHTCQKDTRLIRINKKYRKFVHKCPICFYEFWEKRTEEVENLKKEMENKYKTILDKYDESLMRYVSREERWIRNILESTCSDIIERIECNVRPEWLKPWFAKGPLEIDLVVKLKNGKIIGIEYNDQSHTKSSRFKSEFGTTSKHYHQEKSRLCQENNIDLIYVWYYDFYKDPIKIMDELIEKIRSETNV